MITSRDNETLKLVRKLLGQRKHRDETGLFAVEGEDLVDAASEAGIEPVHLLVAGETVEDELLARVSTLPHPARAIGVYRRSDLPTGARSTCLALWRLSDPGNVGTLLRTADAFGASVALWWLGESFMDIGPYIADASSGELLLLGGVTGRDVPGYHDWENVLIDLGLLQYDRTLGTLSYDLGRLLMLAAFAWGGRLLVRQHRELQTSRRA